MKKYNAFNHYNKRNFKMRHKNLKLFSTKDEVERDALQFIFCVCEECLS